MRIIAVFRVPNGPARDGAYEEILEQIRIKGLLECRDAMEKRHVIEHLVHDMSENVRDRFRATVQAVYKHVLDATLASISVIGDDHIILRLRNPHLNELMPLGHSLIQDILSSSSNRMGSGVELLSCQVRERGNDKGFLFGSWSSGQANIIKHLWERNRFFNSCIVFVFVFGLTLEVLLTLWPQQTRWAELGLRLGAPMLVSSTVLLLERWANWLSLRHPRLRWYPIQPQSSSAHGADKAFEGIT